ncbi:hypothetical protein EDD15DRAFT_875564 [Pisolithus albus]|nr:hypothetical protein EDD15DRAFT_875564 [Pisolithus albus]
MGRHGARSTTICSLVDCASVVGSTFLLRCQQTCFAYVMLRAHRDPGSGDARRRLVEMRSKCSECFFGRYGFHDEMPTPCERYWNGRLQKCLTGRRGRLLTCSCLHLLQDLTCDNANVMRALISVAFKYLKLGHHCSGTDCLTGAGRVECKQILWRSA